MLQQARSAVGAAARTLGRSLDGIGVALETHPYHEQRKSNHLVILGRVAPRLFCLGRRCCIACLTRGLLFRKCTMLCAFSVSILLGEMLTYIRLGGAGVRVRFRFRGPESQARRLLLLLLAARGAMMRAL